MNELTVEDTDWFHLAIYCTVGNEIMWFIFMGEAMQIILLNIIVFVLIQYLHLFSIQN